MATDEQKLCLKMRRGTLELLPIWEKYQPDSPMLFIALVSGMAAVKGIRKREFLTFAAGFYDDADALKDLTEEQINEKLGITEEIINELTEP